MKTLETQVYDAFYKAFDQFPLPVECAADDSVDCGRKFAVAVRFFNNGKEYRNGAVGKTGSSLKKAFDALRKWADAQIT